MQLTKKKSQQSDVVERLKPLVPERPKLVSRNLQTKDVLDENLEEEKSERNNEESGKDGGYHSHETKEIKIEVDDVERGILINDVPRFEMEPLCPNLEDEDNKEEEESDDVNTSFQQNEGRKGSVASVMVLPSISIAHFSKEKELTLAEPLTNVEEKITIEKEGSSCEGKEDDEEDSSGKEVLCYAWQIAKGMVRIFSTEECLEQFSHHLQSAKISLLPKFKKLLFPVWYSTEGFIPLTPSLPEKQHLIKCQPVSTGFLLRLKSQLKTLFFSQYSSLRVIEGKIV